MVEPYLEVQDVAKHFGAIQALKNASIKAMPGQVTMLLGENGAGKSTLMNIISGIYPPDHGIIMINNIETKISSIQKASELGIVIVHQEIQLVEDLSVAENIFLGQEPKTKILTINYKKMYNNTKDLFKKLNIDLSPKELVKDLTIAKKQLVEIAKAMSKKAKLILFDEPTSSIGEKETTNLFAIIKNLKKANVAIIYITHRMSEIEKIGDSITIFRDGFFIDQYSAKNFDVDHAIEKMVGKKLHQQFPQKFLMPKNTVLEIKNLINQHSKNISLKINSGEILCLAGLVGSGRTEFVRALIGLENNTNSNLYLDNELIKIRNPLDALKKQIFYLSEDRKAEGLVLDKSINFNITLPSLKKIFFSHLPVLNLHKENKIGKSYIEQLNIKTNSGQTLVQNLSGGNQQKVAISKALVVSPRILIFDEPTRGVDVGARKEIYDIIFQLKKNGVAIIIVSSDLPEVVGLADRVAVFASGKIEALIENNISQDKILRYAFKKEVT